MISVGLLDALLDYEQWINVRRLSFQVRFSSQQDLIDHMASQGHEQRLREASFQQQLEVPQSQGQGQAAAAPQGQQQPRPQDVQNPQPQSDTLNQGTSSATARDIDCNIDLTTFFDRLVNKPAPTNGSTQ